MGDECGAAPSAGACPLPQVVSPDFQAVFDASPRPLLVIAADPPKFTMVAVNEAHARAFSTTPDQLLGVGVLEAFGPELIPEVHVFVDAIRASLEHVIGSRRSDQMDVRAYPTEGDDGTSDERYWSAVNTPIFGPDGRITHIVSAVQDVTGEVHERRSEAARRLLMREVDHRARNALTIVQSFIRLTRAGSIDEFRRILEGRVAALGRAQTSLASRRWEGASLRHILDQELKPLATEPDAYTLKGPHVLLRAEDVQAMSMATHELATNAAKHGALSTRAGKVRVTWSRQNGTLFLTWSELGLNPGTAPAETGFGSHLVAQLARQMRGEVSYDWRPEGLEVRLRLQTS